MKKLTKEEQHNLVWLYHATQDKQYLSQLICANYPYIIRLAGKTYQQFSKRIPFRDLKQQCVTGLIVAINRFDFEKNCTLLTYADFWMRSVMFNLYYISLPVHIPAGILRKYLYFKLTEEEYKYIKKISNELPIDMNNHSLDFKIAFRSIDYTVQDYERYNVSGIFEQALNQLTKEERFAFSMKHGYDNGGSCWRTNEMKYEYQISWRVLVSAKKKLREFLLKYGTIKELETLAA